MMKQIRNQKGIALLQALMVTAVVGVAAGFIMNQMRLTDNTLVIPRIRSEMMIAESAFRNMAYMNVIYNCNPAVGAMSCTAPNGPTDPADDYLERFESMLPTCTPGPCGVRFDIDETATVGPRFEYIKDSTTLPGTTYHKLHTRIEYSGTGVLGKPISIKPVIIDILIPEHILTGAPFICAAQNGGRFPFFRGFDTNGNPICHGWTSANQTDGRCNPGFYLKSFSETTLQINCEPLATANTITSPLCTATQYIIGFNWPATGGTIEMACGARPNGFTYFGFAPNAPTFN